MAETPIRVLVAGASGYAGALAARLVQRHPRMALAAITSRSDVGRRLDDIYPHHRVSMALEELDLDRHADVDAAIVAYPHAAAAPVVAQLRDRGVKVVDLSADFRLRDLGTYEAWYGEHPEPALLERAVYGLPERYRADLAGAELIANPGCFPTAAILALAPLAPHLEDVVIDAKTGVSGAGRAATDRTHFVSVDENVSPYGVAGHRHAPEIEQELRAAGADDLAITFVPHLLPLDQGELLSCYVRLADGADAAAILAERYADEPFVEVVDRAPGVRDVRETNLCRLHVHRDERAGRTLVFAAIDNLWKGTSSQAIQNLNLMFGLPEGMGLQP
ncbi:MAG TPA: N-acetyl-gamma-glutamyl-phosphate reductase [Solirubrobacteraceae bacterium]|nr:N-acetyl-gamma-glutamyl-phosphate reductase [Solirubrobacteraceae bacterium]